MAAQMAAYGRIAAEVQVKTTGKGTNMAFTRIAVALPCRSAENGEATMWLGVTAFGKQADALARHQKGDLVSVSGQLQVNQWTGQDGGTQNGYALVANSVISAKTARPGGVHKGRQPQEPPAQQHLPEDYSQLPPDDIPF
ncbi:single-stranded DNA-binding protein [Klebsiella aerogenes]|uniref:single-stranded DNA-binding protein n=1 Tax=Klebsiella aerogenes TaxID=548 RepID=UPI001F3B0671|nr:single-stranded DNA-binding protein [Klebsiella aerogenes]